MRKAIRFSSSGGSSSEPDVKTKYRMSDASNQKTCAVMRDSCLGTIALRWLINFRAVVPKIGGSVSFLTWGFAFRSGFFPRLVCLRLSSIILGSLRFSFPRIVYSLKFPVSEIQELNWNIWTKTILIAPLDLIG